MERHFSYSHYAYPSSSHSTADRRASSTTRPLPPITRNRVATITKTISNGGMNISRETSIPTRTTYRLGPVTSERRVQGIPLTTQRAKLPSSYPPNVISIATATDKEIESQPSRPKPVVYSIRAVTHPATNETDDEPIVSKSSSTTTAISELKKGGLAGLQNLGNTCFMNSVLQCLSNTKPLLLFCLQDHLKDSLNRSETSVMKGVLMEEYASLIRRMWQPTDGYAVVSPSSFKNTIGRFAPRFTGYSEQDSQEFLRYLLQGLHEDVNRVQKKPTPIVIDEKKEERMKEKDRAKLSWERCLRYDNSRLVEIFAGQLKSTLECSHCQYQSITFDMFWDLSIPLPRNKSSTTIQECLQLFMSKEELNGDEKPMCAKCKQKRACTKKFSIQKCPEILVLHLKRFSQTRGRSKLNTFVDFPLKKFRLSELTDVMSESHEGPVPTYNLFGISNHSGTLYSGHYIAQCKHPFTQQWHEFNDSSVHALNDESGIVSDNAYVLFYEKSKSDN